jgi:phenylacetate-CoA ligase
VELTPDSKPNVESVEPRLIQQLRLKTGLRYNLEFHDYGTLPRYAVKAKRFKDLRHKE